MRAAEIASNVALDVLMKRAGAALAEAAIRFGHGQAVLVLCGPGNNGGDGYVAAKLLRGRGVDVRVAAHREPQTDISQAARAQWQGAVELLGDAGAAPIVLDCLFGTGLTRPLGDDYALPLQRLSNAAQFVIAADLPSGVGTDDGADLGAAGANITLAFAAAKSAHFLQPAARYCGRVLIADIGVSVDSRVGVLGRPRLTAPGPGDHKYTRGMVAVMAGEMVGAGLLAATAATAAARIAGYTVLCGKGVGPYSIVRRGFTKTLFDTHVDAVLVGPGMEKTQANETKVMTALMECMPLVLDAGALALVTPEHLRRKRSDLKRAVAHRYAKATVITPHDGEFVRLFGKLDGSKIDRARTAAEHSDCTVIYKGSDTIVASPDGRATVVAATSHWLASAGTGDVLAGIVLAMLGRGLEAHDAACAALWVHGEAARLAGPGLIADDLCDHIAGALREALV